MDYAQALEALAKSPLPFGSLSPGFGELLHDNPSYLNRCLHCLSALCPPPSPGFERTTPTLNDQSPLPFGSLSPGFKPRRSWTDRADFTVSIAFRLSVPRLRRPVV